MLLVLMNCFVPHALHVVLYEVMKTSLAAAVVTCHLLMLGSLLSSSHRRKRMTSSSFKTTLLVGGRPRFLLPAVAAADNGVADSDMYGDVRNIRLL